MVKGIYSRIRYLGRKREPGEHKGSNKEV